MEAAVSLVQGQQVGWVAGLCALVALALRALRGRTAKGAEPSAPLPRIVLWAAWQPFLALLGVRRAERRAMAVDAARADLGLPELPTAPSVEEAA